MGQKQPDFETIYKDLKQQSRRDDLDEFKKADHLRNSAAIEIKQCSKNNSPYAADLLKQNLSDYFDHVTNSSPNSVNNYMNNVMELMKQHTNIEDEGFSPVRESYLDDPSKYYKVPECQGQYEQCRNDEVTEDMLKNWFQKPKAPVIEKEEIRVIKHITPQVIKRPVITLKPVAVQNIPEAIIAPIKPITTFQFKQKKTEEYTTSSQIPIAAKTISNSIFSKPLQNFCPKPTLIATKPAPIATKPAPIVSPHSSQSPEKKNDFKTGLDEFKIQNVKKGNANNPPIINYGKKSLGGRRGAIQDRFVCPVQGDEEEERKGQAYTSNEDEEEVDERLKNIDKKMIELIRNEIMETSSSVATTWADIAGLESAKSVIYEAVILPLLRPDIFKGLRAAPRGILLFGPPGTGKTLIGKCIASQSNATFFSISASSLTSKWVGECEKMVRALFAVAKVHQPSVIFIDEIDSMLCQRTESEHESSRRLKTEFLVQLDGAGTSGEERILIVGATNRPQELDEAARRRLVKRLYIPLPIKEARMQIVKNLLKTLQNSLTPEDIDQIGEITEGYSGADIKSLCHDASMGPIRELSSEQMAYIAMNDLRLVNFNDFKLALSRIRPSVSQKDLGQYLEWNKLYGSG